MINKRQRPCLERACKKREPEDAGALNPLELSPKLWRKLPVVLAYKVLSYLPVDVLVDTLRHVNRKWQKSPGFSQIFGHGDNLVSSYGFVTLPNREVPRLVAFEHESMKWREFPQKLPAEVKQARLISGGNDGLLMCLSKKCRITNLSYSALMKLAEMKVPYYPGIGVWNPLLHSFKWLPLHPQQRSLDLWFKSVVMVDEPSKTYKVFLHYEKVYSEYNCTTQIWSRSKLIPSFGVYRHSVSCNRYIVFDDAYDYRDDSLYLYDVQRDSWDRVFVSKILTDLDCSSHGGGTARIASFAILRGILYTLICGTSEGIVMVSMDLSAETPTFKLETIVPFPSLHFGGRRVLNLYTYTLKGKGFVCVRTASASNQFRHFDVSRGDWLESNKFPDLRANEWNYGQDCFSFKPSFVVP